jgi:hypothetical protein
VTHAPHFARLTLLVACLLATGPAALATETDQFTTPTAPLQDIGPRLSRKVAEILEADRTGDDPERILLRWVGRDVIESRLSRWVREIPTTDGPVLFRPNPFHSIYNKAMSPVPASFLFDSPTVHVHGYYMGTDKLDHFFQQGHKYFAIVMKSEAKGMDPAEAVSLAVAHGVHQEHEYYGTLVSGVYSNGDLAANFAGMKFYLNLRHAVRIGDRVIEPLLERTAEGWRLRRGVDPDHLLEPYLSNHLDESLNPSRYRFSRRFIRAKVAQRCDAWSRFYADRLNLVHSALVNSALVNSASDTPSGPSFYRKSFDPWHDVQQEPWFDAQLERSSDVTIERWPERWFETTTARWFETWFGEDYGHLLPPSEEISIATECPVRESFVQAPTDHQVAARWSGPRIRIRHRKG